MRRIILLLVVLGCLVGAASASAGVYYVGTSTACEAETVEGHACGSYAHPWGKVSTALTYVKYESGFVGSPWIKIKGRHVETVSLTHPGCAYPELCGSGVLSSEEGGTVTTVKAEAKHWTLAYLKACITVSGEAEASVTMEEDVNVCPSSWLGLNSNSNGVFAGGTYATYANTTLHAYWDRGGNDGWEPVAGETPESTKGVEGGLAEDLKASHEAGMKPIVTIRYAGEDEENEYAPDPNFPGASSEQRKAYVKGFVKTAEKVLANYSNAVFEVINEPWAKTYPEAYDGRQYGEILAELMPALTAAGIPLSKVYVAAYGEGDEWINGENSEKEKVKGIYRANSNLEDEILGWYYHCDGGSTGECLVGGGASDGIGQAGRSEMQSGKYNIIASEVGENYEARKEGSKGAKEAELAAKKTEFKEVLNQADTYHNEGWLTALLIYSRSAGAWAMMKEGKSTPLGEVFEEFAKVYG